MNYGSRGSRPQSSFRRVETEDTPGKSRLVAFKFDDIYEKSEDTTETISQLKTHQIKIRQLTEENIQLQERIERLKIQLNQIDLYKDQVQNLKEQVQVCEGKIKFYDAENSRRQEHLEEQFSISSTKESNLFNEIERKDKIIASMITEMKEQEAKMKGFLEVLEKSKQDKIELIKKVDFLKEELKRQKDEFDRHEKQGSKMHDEIEKSLKLMEMEKDRFTGKINELQEQLDIEQIDKKEKLTMIEELTLNQNQLGDELDKCHSHIEAQQKYITELKEENKYIPQLSAKIKELSQSIEILNSEIERERQKSQKSDQAKDQFQQQLQGITAKYSGENAPEYLQKQLLNYKQKIAEKEKENINLKEKFQKLEKLQRETQISNEEELTAISTELRNTTSILESAFTSFSHELEQEAFDSTGIQYKPIIHCFKELRKAIVGIQAGILKSFSTIESENEMLQKELTDTNALKNEILIEVERFKTLLEDQDFSIQKKEEENLKLNDELNNIKNNMQNIQAQYEKESTESAQTFSQVYENLLEIISKYEGVDFVLSRVNLVPINDFAYSKNEAVMELIQITKEITNVLNFEMKNLNIKVMEAQEAAKKLELIQEEMTSEMQCQEIELKTQVTKAEGILASKQEQFDILTTNYEKHNTMEILFQRI